MMNNKPLPVEQVKAGMVTPWWTALADAEVKGDEVYVRIEHRDGGHEVRVWNLGQTLPVRTVQTP